ncbi:hypothetical protein [Paraburkholderia jirisanensis]
MIAPQGYQISTVNDAMTNRTIVHTLLTGHSPPVTHAAALADRLLVVAGAV